MDFKMVILGHVINGPKMNASSLLKHLNWSSLLSKLTYGYSWTTDYCKAVKYLSRTDEPIVFM